MQHQPARLAGALASLLLIVLCCAVPARAASPQAPLRVTLGPSLRAGPWTHYGLTVRSAGAPVLIVLSGDVISADLEINGAVVQSTGAKGLGLRPLGHAASAFRLANVTPRDRIAIRQRGSSAPPQIEADVPLVTGVFHAGLMGGIYYGLLVSIALFQLVLAFTLRRATVVWFCGWIFSLIGFEAVRDNFLELGPAAAGAAIVLLNVVAQVGYVGFVCAYLRLLEVAPRLFWLFVATNLASDALPFLVGLARHEVVDLDTLYLTGTISVATCIAIALRRRSAGFAPAAFIAFGLLGSLAALGSSSYRALAGTDSAFLDRWSVELGFAFDVLIFSVGLTYRARFTQRERATVEAELREASRAAGHDPLTGLLNRRGLEAWLNAPGRVAGSVLFLDIDGFKEINDEGGHAAGDDVLSVVARIVRHAVRAEDATARFGGDEFVVVLAGRFDATIAQDVIARISSAVGFLLPLGPNSRARVGVSIGRAALAADVPFAQALLLADADAYRVKAEHRALGRRAARQH